MTKLVTLSGAAQAINPEIANIDPKELSDFDAGIVFFRLVAELYPGITWGELWDLAPAKMSGWWTDLKKGTGDIYDSLRGVVGDVKDGIGDIGSNTVRLIASEDVSKTVNSALAASQGKVLPGDTGKDNDLMALIGALFSKGGEEYKKSDIPPAVIYGGAAALAAIVLIAVLKK